jgi:hypothetical protein
MAFWQQTSPRIRVALIILAAVCLLALVSGRAIFLSYLKTSLTSQLAEEYKLQLTVGEMGGSLVKDLRLAQIRATRTDASATVAEIAIDSLQAQYSLLDLFGGVDTFLANTRITITRGAIVLDLAAPEDADSTVTPMPSHLPRIAGKELSLILQHGKTTLLLADCDLSVDGAVATGRGQSVKFVSRGISLVPEGGKIVPSSGSVSLLYGPKSLDLQTLVLNGEEILGTGQFLFAQKESPASFTLGLQAFGGDIDASGNFAEGRSAFSLRLAALDLARLAPLFPLSGYDLTGAISAQAETTNSQAGLVGTLTAAWQGTVNGEGGDFSCAASLNNDALVVKQLVMELAGNRLALTDGVVPYASLAEPQGLVAAVSVAHCAVRLENIPALWKMADTSPATVPLPPRHLLELEGSIGGKRLVLTRGRFESSKNSLTLSQGTMQLPDAGQPFAAQPLTGNFRFALTDLRELASLASLPKMDGSLRGTMAIRGTLQAPEGHLTAQGENLRYQGCPLGQLRLEAKADGKQVQVLSVQVKQGQDRLRFSGRYSLARRAVEALEGELSIKELGRYGAACKEFSGDLSGSLHATVTGASNGRQHISLRLRNVHLASFTVAKGDLALETGDWRSFACKEAALETSQGAISLSGLVVADFARQSVTATVQQLILSRGGTRFAAEKHFVLTAFYGGKKSLAIDTLLLGGPMGSLSASGRLSRQEEGSFQLKASGFKSGEWLEGLLVPGYSFQGLELNLAIKSPLNRGRGSLVASVAALSTPQFAESFVGGVDLDYSPEGLRLKKFVLNNAHGQQFSLAGRIPYDPFAEKVFLAGPLSLTGQLKLPALAGGVAGPPKQGTVVGELVGEINLSGSWQQPVGRATIRAKNLAVPQLQGVLPPEPINLDCTLALQGQRLQLTRCKFDSASSSGTLAGEWRQLPSLAELLRRPTAELPGTIAVDGTLNVADIGWFARESKAVRRLTGSLSSSFSVTGRASAPKLSGGITFTDGGLRFAGTAFPPMDGVTIRADFAGETIRIQSLDGLLGGAPFHGAGSLVLAGAETRFDFTAKGKNLLLYRDADLKIRGDADLRLRGPLSKLALSGKLIVTDGRYTKNLDFLRLFKGTAKPRSDIGLQIFSLPDPPFRDMELAIEISSAQPFLLKNNLAKGSVRPVFRLGGTGELPVLVGRVFIDPTNISLPAGRLAIESGVITFPENDPDRPTFDLTAKSRMAGYDIDMLLQGTAEEPVITLSSQPPLSDSDLLLLVLTGRPPVNGKGTGRRQVAGMNMAVYLGKGLLANWFGLGATESDASVLERFDLDIGRQITSRGEDTVEAQFRLIEGLLLPGDRLFITSERDVYDNYNVGVKIVFRFK